MFNENWYPEYQLTKLVNLCQSVKNIEGDILEIGCWEGRSTIGLTNSCYPETLICIDNWLGNIQESICTGITHPTELILTIRDVHSTFINNMNTCTQKNYTIVEQNCLEWLQTYNGNIKFIHIDASNDYESVLATINLVLPKLVKGGIICGDDYINAGINRDDLHGGVGRAVSETLPNHKSDDNLWYYINVDKNNEDSNMILKEAVI
jgi:predicted O-methyltransferase YrrM